MKQTMYTNGKRCPEPEYKVRDKVYPETKDLCFYIKQSDQGAKFYLRYMGPFKIIKSHLQTFNYILKLPSEY